MLVGRNREYTYFEDYMNRDGSQMVVFYGQKFMGKTSFLLDFFSVTEGCSHNFSQSNVFVIYAVVCDWA